MRRHSGNYHWAKTRRRSLLTYGRNAPEWVTRPGDSGPAADWDYDFINDRAFERGYGESVASERFPNWSRTGGNYYTNLAGELIDFGPNVPRIGDRGLLVEYASTNIIHHSNDISNGSSWGLNALTNLTTKTTGPDGVSNSATLLNEDATTDGHFVYQQRDKAASAVTYTASFYAKASASRYRVTLEVYTGASGNGLIYTWDLSQGLFSSPADRGGGGWNSRRMRIEPLANGWYRCSATFQTDTGVTINYLLLTDNGDGADAASVNFAGTVGQGIYIFGTQIEVNSFASSYIPTSATAVQRTYEGDNSHPIPFRGLARTSNAHTFLFDGTYLDDTPNPMAASFNALYAEVSNTDRQQFSGAVGGANFSSNGLSSNVVGMGSYTAQIGFNTFTVDFKARHRYAVRYQDGVGNSAHCVDGRTPIISNPAYGDEIYPPAHGVPLTKIGVGGNADYSFFGYIRRASAWHSGLTDAQLQLLTDLDTAYDWALDADYTASFDLDFLGDRAWDGEAEVDLEDVLTFDRDSPGYYTNADGTLTKFGDVARINNILYSQEFDNAIWAKNRVTVIENTMTAPDGTLTAAKFVANTDANRHYVSQPLGLDAPLIYSVYAKSDDSAAQVMLGDNAAGKRASYTLSGAGTATGLHAQHIPFIEALDDGWYRCSLLVFAASGIIAINDFWMGVCFGNDEFAAGDGVSGVYFWGAQIEHLTSWNQMASAYLPTTSAPVTVAAVNDVLRIGDQGLLVEEGRTNICTYSQQFNIDWQTGLCIISPNTALALDGTLTADSLIEKADNARQLVFRIVNTDDTVTYTFSTYLKANTRNYGALSLTSDTVKYGVNFDLINGVVTDTDTTGSPAGTSNNIEALADGWYRCSASITSSGTSIIPQVCVSNSATPTWSDSAPSYAGNGTSGIYIWGAQLEAGAAASSYIPTLDASVTRPADHLTTNSEINPLINPIQGTVVMFGKTLPGIAPGPRGDWFNSDPGAAIAFLGSSFYIAGSFGGGSVTPDVVHKVALGYFSGNSAGSFDGNIATHSVVFGGVKKKFVIGAHPGGNEINGYVQRFAYYNYRLANATLQTLAT